MNRVFLMTLGVLSLFTTASAQDSLQATIILIGDAGQLTNGRNPVVEAARRTIPFNKNTTVVYLGDNLYKKGLPDDAMPTYDIAKAPLDSQIVIARGTDTKVYFVPGNHDWANGASIGYESILRVQSYIDILGNDNVRMYPRNGCPGPEEVAINKDITLIMMDSQWWLQEEDKPGIESDCPTKTKEEFLTLLNDMLAKNSKKLVIIAMHHPLKSYGPHGGYFTLKQHIFPFTDAFPKLYLPLPVIGSAYPLTRAVFGTIQDLKHPLYQNMINSLQAVVKNYRNVIFTSGHEHTLQLISDSGRNYVVSGSGSKSNRVSKGKNTLYSSSDFGFATLEISKNKNVRASFFTTDTGEVKQTFTQNILNFTTIDAPEVKDTLRKIEYAYKDTVVISASDKYKNTSKFKKGFLGKNYRTQWSEAIPFKVFNINKEKGGLTAISLGGGKQTKSLKLKDKNGKEWTLRTIDKDPEKAVPANLRGTIAQSIVEDMISASHPYSPLAVPTLAEAGNVPAATPEFFFVPDDPALGIYRKVFANTVCMLEDRDPTPDGTDTKSTSTIIAKIVEDNDDRIDQPAVLRARLLDMLIGDFDRHADQWKWGVKDTGKGKVYYPVPRDRDQAFFDSDGLLLKIVSQMALPYLRGFKNDLKEIHNFNEVAKDFDRVFLNRLNKTDWDTIATNFASNITNDVINKAIQEMPPKIRAMDSAILVKKLIARRDALKRAAMVYYEFLAKEVTVTGTNQKEYFLVEEDGKNLLLSVFKKKKDNDSVSLMYKRSFDPSVTKEIRLYGFNGDDKFEFADNASSKIKIRIIGGKGADTFNIKGSVKNYLYDLTTEKNDLQQLERTKKNLSSDPQVLSYEYNNYKYNRFNFPQINFGFNPEDLFLFGVGFTSTRHGFRKEPYKSQQKFTSLIAPARRAFQLGYRGVFNGAFLKNDVIVNARYVNPTLNNFFGFGNETVFDKSKPLEFYRVRYNFLETDLLLRKRYKDLVQFSYGGTYYKYGSEFKNNDKRIINNPALFDSASIFSDKQYAGVKLNLDINYINNLVFPSRGITWYSAFTNHWGLNSNSGNLTKVTSDMTIYATVSDKSRVTTVLRAGGGHIFSDNTEYFQALTLGANNYNRGFRKNRFSGTSLLYGGAEVRIKLFKSKSYALPGDVGLISYYDIGRVWNKDESSRKFHNSFGGGLYFSPFGLTLISATLGISPEDQLINFSVGTKFNLTF